MTPKVPNMKGRVNNWNMYIKIVYAEWLVVSGI
jgi:hypothetical protein